MFSDPFMPYLFRIRDKQQRVLKDNLNLDMFWSMLTIPADFLFPSELAESGHIQWTHVPADLDSGLVRTIKLT